jgi:hypothetical protein
MVPGLARAVNTVTLRGVTELCPQPLTAMTVTIPELLPAATVMLLVLLEPVHPEGIVQT